MNIPKKATGKPKATQNAKRVFKNIDKKSNTNNIPTIAFSVSNAVRWFSVMDRSRITFSCTLLFFILNSVMYSFIVSADDNKSSLLVLVTETLTERSPLK